MVTDAFDAKDQSASRSETLTRGETGPGSEKNEARLLLSLGDVGRITDSDTLGNSGRCPRGFKCR